MEANSPDCPITLFVRGLKKSRALRGVEVIPGAPGMARQTAPGRIVIWPSDGEFTSPGDVSVSIFDDQQQLVAELWAKGSSRGGEEAALADWNAAWALLVKFMQALVEQGEAPQTPDAPGAFWQAIAGPSWSTAQDVTQQGTAIKVLCAARCPIPAASDDQGHVGDNWDQGTAEGVDITGAP